MRSWIFSPALLGAAFICATTIVSAAEEANLLVAIHGVAEVYPAEGRSAAGYVVFAGDPLILRGSFVNESSAMIRIRDGGCRRDSASCQVLAYDFPASHHRLGAITVGARFRTGASTFHSRGIVREDFTTRRT